ncbi:Dna2/Cas4 domain-containing protein [Kyrpidia sp.]|uniref:CRISPR-associated protein Cas4 n=1 Tax=Kyrpidia sp. TaxID=2073077 RepID=UPI00258F46E0|nr:Dna2/Cas4 domain-containing protein [Kyrpidia sp.]MCL6576735.1 CRISPR-associated protein Cas4 [Kyrpidia sp.]
MVSERLKNMLYQAEELGIHGLLFQHITLCEVRAWLHYHRIDCAHLNRHMQRGLWVSATTYERRRDRVLGLGIYPDQIDWADRTVSEVKSAKRPDDAGRLQLLFYVAVLEASTGESWTGLLRTPTSRRVQRVCMDRQAEDLLLAKFEELVSVLRQPRPPQKTEKPVCTGCSYRLLCWGQTTEEES